MTFSDKLRTGRHYMTRAGRLVGPLVELSLRDGQGSLPPMFSIISKNHGVLECSESWDGDGRDRRGAWGNHLLEIVPEFRGWEPTMEYRIPTNDDEAYVDAGSCPHAPEGQNGVARCYGQGDHGVLVINLTAIGHKEGNAGVWPRIPCFNWDLENINMNVFDGKRVIMRRARLDYDQTPVYNAENVWEML